MKVVLIRLTAGGAAQSFGSSWSPFGEIPK
jgi:hypothetical protein